MLVNSTVFSQSDTSCSQRGHWVNGVAAEKPQWGQVRVEFSDGRAGDCFRALLLK